MVDYRQYHESQQLLLQTVDEESESEQDDEMQDDVRSNSSTLKSTSQPAGWSQRQGAVGVAMTESTDSGLESDKNVDTEQLTTQNNNSRQHRNENLLYHCQVGLGSSLSFFTLLRH